MAIRADATVTIFTCYPLLRRSPSLAMHVTMSCCWQEEESAATQAAPASGTASRQITPPSEWAGQAATKLPRRR